VYYQRSSHAKSKTQQLLGGKLTLSQLKAGLPCSEVEGYGSCFGSSTPSGCGIQGAAPAGTWFSPGW